jgi:uncharacterized protein (TIGR00251 family)
VPGAARTGLVGRHGTSWKVRVSAPPEGGRANEAVVRLVAATVGVRSGDVSIVAGHGSRDKVVAVEGLTAGELEARLAASVPGGSGA